MEFLRPITNNIAEKERFALYFDSLSAAMEAKYDWASSGFRRGPRFKPKRNTGRFWDLQRGECCYRAWFPARKTESVVVAGLQIRESQALLDAMRELKTEIESDFGDTLDWSQRLCDNPKTQNRKFIFASRRGNISLPETELQEIGEWHIDTLLKLDKAFTPRIEEYIS